MSIYIDVLNDLYSVLLVKYFMKSSSYPSCTLMTTRVTWGGVRGCSLRSAQEIVKKSTLYTVV